METEQLDDTIEKDEFWAGPDGLPTRGLFTLTGTVQGASGQTGPDPNNVLRTIEVNYSGFGLTNTIAAPISPQATPTPTPTP